MKQAWSKEEIATIASDITDEAIDENIEANPTLEGDEETLSSIGIKGVNYAVGGGSEVHLHRHLLEFTKYGLIEIINNSSEPLTITSLKANCQGTYTGSYFRSDAPAGTLKVLNKCVITSGSITFYMSTFDLNNNVIYNNEQFSMTSLTDTITQIF